MNFRKPNILFASPLFHICLITIVGILIYSNTFQVPFVFDDEASITQQHVIKNLNDFIFGGSEYRNNSTYNPRRFIGSLTIALNYHWGGLNVTGYHIFNLAVHITTALLVYALVRLTLRTPFFQVSGSDTADLKLQTSRFVPLLAALLFVSHPVQTQAVTYIIQRVTSLATLLFVLSLVSYIKGRLCAETSGKPFSLRAVTWFAFALLSALAAMWTKEISFTLPFIVALFEFSFFRNSLRKKILFFRLVLLSLVVFPLCFLGTDKPIGELISDIAEKTRLQTDMPRLDYLFTQFRVIVTYLRLLIFPVNQNLDYDYPIYRSFFTPPVFLSFLLLLALFALAVYLFYRSKTFIDNSTLGCADSECSLAAPVSRFSIPESRLISFGILWFFVTLSVESSFIPIVDIIFEHRLYLPSVGAFIAISTVAAFLLRNAPSTPVVVAAAAVVVVLAGATFARNLVWGDAVTLARDIVQKSPGIARAHYNLALALDDTGRPDEALREAAIAAKLDREDARPWNLIGTILAKKGKYDEAIEWLSLALELYPEAPYTHSNLGSVYMSKGMSDQAMEHFFNAMRLDPKNPEIYNKIGKAYSISSNTREGIAFFERAVALEPSHPEYRFNLHKATAASVLTDSGQGHKQ